MHTIKLRSDQAAVVTDEDELYVLMPEHDDEDLVPDILCFLIACVARQKAEPQFMEDMVRWLEFDVQKSHAGSQARN